MDCAFETEDAPRVDARRSAYGLSSFPPCPRHAMAPSTPRTPPSRVAAFGVASQNVPGTPRKQAYGYGFQGTKRLTDALRPESLSKRLKLPFDPVR